MASEGALHEFSLLAKDGLFNAAHPFGRLLGSAPTLGGYERCLIGELLGASASAAVLGGVAALVCGDQSLAQFLMQAAGAGVGSYVMAGPVGCPLMPDSGLHRHGRSGGDSGGDYVAGPVLLSPRLAGAAALGLLAWLVFTPGLDFQLVASSIMVSAGAAGGTIVMEPSEEAVGKRKSRRDDPEADFEPPGILEMESDLTSGDGV
mmetsp:Transcript_111453/g.314701  ORF Transcript_111453/g.314701 Transcript_111453/m.314701 type:complete len:205 (-) Transcript_111453:111-725(-)|eukprot:CAMPEP_0117571672 /NCGR_PEP_ID=MMETSP0784-20121206/59888_1 /TAXON_ID=39447 /ORGANISM="" /LENGTH=204 /DNA_ID=CAMNT_0005369871 /DNA_START=38 /DNA_END=652 /DNA_ORIENTATION=+